MAAPSYTYTLSNGSTADASQVMQNFNDILNGITDGTKDLTISALTANGATNLKAAVTLGLSSANDLTVNGSLASTIPVKTNNAVAIGSSTKGLSGVYLGNGGAGLTCQLISASHATTRNYTFPDAGAAANVLLSEGTTTVNGAYTFTTASSIKGIANAGQKSTGYIGEYQIATNTAGAASPGSADTWTDADTTNLSVTVSAGIWLVGFSLTLSVDSVGPGGVRLNLATDGAVAGTNCYVGFPASGSMNYRVSAQSVMNTSTASQTLRVQTRRISGGTIAVQSNSITGSLTNPDNDNMIWAVRIA